MHQDNRKICPKTGQVISLKTKWYVKWGFPILGLGSLIWFLIRVLPKPSRATYPCMKVAAPLASSFVSYVVGLSASVIAFRSMSRHFRHAKFWVAGLCLFAGVFALTWTLTISDKPARAESYATLELEPNQPFGEANGLFPGRVVWVHNPDATNENWKMSNNNHWALSKNTDQEVVDQMVSQGIQSLTGKASDAESWEAIFKYYNENHDKGSISYQPGEIIFIKINATSTWDSNINNDLTYRYNPTYYAMSETAPQVVLSVLRRLVNVVGVAQKDIYVGDPMKHIYQYHYELMAAEFPDVNYLDNNHGASYGRVQVTAGTQPKIFFSDRGTVLRTGSWNDATAGSPVHNDRLYTILEEMDYMINIPEMKGHKRAGITMFAKNHFGSHVRENALHLHNGLIAPEEQEPRRAGYGQYRVLTDIMGHKILGGKNLFYLMDALWSTNDELYQPRKYQMGPFNNDYSSSLFFSQDPVAIESVGYDFLRSEFTVERGYDAEITYPQMEGADDHLHQAASSEHWAEGITYDPEDDGTAMPSLGVHEHWNNPEDQQYTRNLGTGNGIELVKISSITSVNSARNTLVDGFSLSSNYPNPFNPSTNIPFNLATPSYVELNIYNITGQKVNTLVNSLQAAGSHTFAWDGRYEDGHIATSGVYVYKIRIQSGDKVFYESRKMLLVK